MNKKAQTGPVGFIFHIGFFFIFVAIAGGTIWGLVALAADTVGLTGIEAFIMHNFAMITIISAILGMIAFFSFGGR